MTKVSSYTDELRDALNGNAVYSFMLLFSFGSFIYLLSRSIDADHALIVIEPICFIVFFVLFIRPSVLKKPVIFTLVFMYFLKLCVVPTLSYLGNYFTIVSYGIYIRYWNEACIIVAIEWLIVSAVISYKIRWVYEDYSYNEYKNPQIIKIFVVFLGLICLVEFVLYPNLSNEFFLVFGQDNTALAGRTQGIIYYSFKVFLEWIRPLIVFLIISKIYTSRVKHKKLICFFIAALSAIIMTEYRIVSLAIAIVIIFMVLSDNNSQREKQNNVFIKTAVGVGLFFILISSTIKNKTYDATMSNICRLADIYLGGYMTTAAGLSVKLSHGFGMFLNDIYSGSYLLSSVFGHVYTTTNAINDALNSGAKGAFFELSAQTKAMFGIFYPIAIIIVTDVAIKMQRLFESENILIYKLIYLYCGISISLFMVMYTYTMLCNFIIYKCLIWLLLIWLDQRIIFTIGRSR